MILSIGHSNHSIERFLALLAAARIDAIADVRTIPASQYCPHFNRAPLTAALAAAGVAYVFLGDSLGGKRRAPPPVFAGGIEKLLRYGRAHRIAMLCAERAPENCHRYRLIARHLAGRGVNVDHVHADGRIERHADAEARIAATFPAMEDLFV